VSFTLIQPPTWPPPQESRASLRGFFLVVIPDAALPRSGIHFDPDSPETKKWIPGSALRAAPE
jgi:hypothetical protein